MVYSVRTNKPIVSSKPLKDKRIQGDYSKKVEDYMASHTISIHTDENGKVIVEEKQK